MSTQITAAEIFEANQILTLDVVESLIGKTIAVTNGESKYNKPHVRVCKVLGAETYFDAAAKMEHGTYPNLQAMWVAENNQRAIEWAKNRTVLMYEGQNPYATVENGNGCLPKGTFFGSDADREIYYVEVVTAAETITMYNSGELAIKEGKQYIKLPLTRFSVENQKRLKDFTVIIDERGKEHWFHPNTNCFING